MRPRRGTPWKGSSLRHRRGDIAYRFNAATEGNSVEGLSIAQLMPMLWRFNAATEGNSVESA